MSQKARNKMLVAKAANERRLADAGFDQEPNNVWRRGLHWVQLETYGIHYALNTVEGRYNETRKSRRYDTPEEAKAIVDKILISLDTV